MPHKLTQKIADAIAASGPMRFDRFMEAALFDPEFGYYSSGRAEIGRRGDFYTSVSVGPVYGKFIAAQLAEIFDRLQHPAEFSILEQGANDAALAEDILNALQADYPDIYGAVRYVLIEPFEHLARTQRERLAHHASHVKWVATLESIRDAEGVHFSNEYADALPVRLLVKSGAKWLERHVTLDEGRLVFSDLATDVDFQLPDVPDGYIAEIRPAADAWVRDVCKCFQRGVILIADYGFPREVLHAPWRTDGTFSCYAGHQRDANPLECPGEKDITAHVDFTAIAEAAKSGGFEPTGFADQCHFLAGLLETLVARADARLQASLTARERSGFLTLMHPEMMGTQFKFLALARGIKSEPPLAGFRHASKGIPFAT